MTHHSTCDYWLDLYPWECTCGATQADIGMPISELVQRAGNSARLELTQNLLNAPQ